MKGLVIAIATAALAAPAQAAAPWSAPTDVGPPSDYVQAPRLAFSPAGSGLLGWLVRMGGEPGAVGGPLVAHNDGYSGRIASLGANGVLGSVRTLPDSVAAGPALDATGRGLVLRTLALSTDDSGRRRFRLTWSNVSRNGTVGRARPLATATMTDPPALAVGARGDAVAAWNEYRSPASPRELWGTFRIRAAWRARGGSFGRPVTLLDTQALDYEHNGAVTAAIGRRGRAVVVFADARERPRRDRRTVLAWTRDARRGFGRTLVVGPHAGFARMAAAVTDRGRVIVAWGTQDGGEEANRPWVVRAATLATRARKFSHAQTLDPGHGISYAVGSVALAVAADGRATAAWSGVRRAAPMGVTFPVMSATSDAIGRFGPAAEIAPDGIVGGLAVRADGAAIVTWVRTLGPGPTTGQASAAVRAAGARTFGAAEAIADPDVASPPTPAFDPVSGSPVVAWAARPNGVDPSMGLTRTAVLRLATRQAP
jgi:hypothetical protein